MSNQQLASRLIHSFRLFPRCGRLYTRSQSLIFRAVEDADLISRVRRGDVEAFNLLVSRWEKRVFNYLLRLTGSPDDALDLSQDVFLEGLSEYPQARRPGAIWPLAVPDCAQRGLFAVPQTPARNGAAEDAKLRCERNAAPGFPMDLSLAVTAALDRLNPEQREAVVLKVYRGFQIRGDGGDSGCPVSTVKSRLYTALDLLKTELAPAKYERYKMIDIRLRPRRRTCAITLSTNWRPTSARAMEQHLAVCEDCAAGTGPAAADHGRSAGAARPRDSAAHRFRFRQSVRAFAGVRLFAGFWNSAARLGFARPACSRPR